jgi:RHS repeat-associated protein
MSFNANSQTTGPVDDQTPLALTPGAPAGSRVEDLATVNLFNGHLNFVLPLASVSGRGELKVPISLNIQRHWLVGMRCDLTVTGQTVCRRYADPSWWGSLQVGYGPGVVQGRGAVGSSGPIGNGVSFTFTDSTGTEHELRDSLTTGQPNPNGQGFNRGTNFFYVDGSSITYVSVVVVNDRPANGSDPTVANGFLFLPNGTRYRIETGLVRWIRDRNGNKLTYTYVPGPGGFVQTITDSVGRTITVNYNVNDPTHGLCDQIVVPGFGASTRTITITKSPLGGALRYDYPQPLTYGQLFPEITNDINYNNQFNPFVVTGVYLPNGQSLKFFYNPYGDLARIQVPEGGAVDYDFLGGITNLASTGAVFSSNIYRRVVTRRVYTDAANLNSLQRVVTYSRPETWNNSTGRADSVGFVAIENRTAGNSLLSYEKHYFHGVAINSYFTLNPYAAYKEGKEYKTETLALDQTTELKRVEKQWRQRAAVPWWSSYVASRPFLNINDEPANDPRVVEIIETIEPSGANLVAKVTTINPSNPLQVGFENNNQTDSWTFDYGVGAPSTHARRHDHFDYLNVDSVTGINYSGPANGSSYTASDVHLRSLVRARKIYSVNPANGTETLAAQTETLYDEYGQSAYPLLTYAEVSSWIDPGAGRGNVTTTRNWVNTSGAWLESHTQYDQCGSVRKTWDARDITRTNPSQITYTDAFSDGVVRNTHAFPTTVTTSIPDQSGAHGSNQAFVSTSVYDFNTGKTVSTTEPNGAVSTFDYSDPLNRLKQVTNADGGRIRYNYFDTPGNLYVQTLTDLDSSRSLETRNYLDGLGRTIRSFTYDGTASTPWTVVDTYYDVVGRVEKQSQPYRVGSANSTLPATCSVCSTAVYDTLGRILTATSPDNAQVVTSYGASTSGVLGITSTVTDQAGRKRRTLVDALGRLVRVDEPNETTGNLDVGGSSTSYTYDVSGNLRKVTQGVQQRFYLYDSLGRLLRSRNPEEITSSLASNLTDEVTGNTQWSNAYTYDNVGNIVSRMDARNVTSTFAYDALSRLQTRSYDDGTASVSFMYDDTDVDNAKGRLTSVSSSVSTYSYGEYDAMGRVKESSQTIDGVTYLMSYTYNLAGSMNSQIYPSGKVITYEYDDAGRLAGLKNQASPVYYAGAAATDSANRILYSPHGAVSQMRLGNNLWEHTNYNSRLQPEQKGLGTSGTNSTLLQLDYNYGGTSNNGNVQSQTITLPGLTPLTQNYSYDQLNRLSFAEEVAGTNQIWKQGYKYSDQNGANAQYGNRRLDSANTTPALLTENPVFDPATNRILPQAGEQYTYDEAGNLTKNKTGISFGYDAENKQISFNGGNPLSGGATYSYDGEGRRVKKVSVSGSTIFVYNVQGQLVAEYGATQPTAGGINYLTADCMGTPRVITNSAGVVIGRHDYLPFGEELPATYGGRSGVVGYPPTDTLRQKFTQKERDIETQLDYFLARYYSSILGRFTSVDPKQAGAVNEDPQSWNAYSYGRSSPLLYSDPDGKKYLICDAYGKNCTETSDDDFWRERKELKKTGNKYTGSGDFFEAGRILNEYGETVATYVQISIDDLSQQYIYGIRAAVDPIPMATAQFFGISLVAGTAGGAAVYALTSGAATSFTTLGLASKAASAAPLTAGAAGLLNQLSRTDRAIFAKASELGASAQNSFMNNVGILRDAVFRVIGPDAKINVIGSFGNTPIYGSLVSRVGITQIQGVTYVVRVTNGNIEILGPLP